MKNSNEMFFRINNDGNAAVFHNSGEPVTRIGADVYPVDSSVSARYEHPEGIVLSIDDAKKLNIVKEN